MSHLDPIVIDGLKFDKGMTLFEFDAFREPEKTRFQKIGEYVKARCPMNEIPTPQMYWQGRYWPDLFIANQLDVLRGNMNAPDPAWDLYYQSAEECPNHPINKAKWNDDTSLLGASQYVHGTWFHDSFIEPMCRKITGRSSNEIAAKYHRSIWLPIFYPETLREGKSLRTPFWYPKEGCAGGVQALLARRESLLDGMRSATPNDSASITLTFLLAKPRHPFSVLFVVDPSPIYRITDMDVCEGIDSEWHRWVLEGSAPNSGMAYGWAEETRGIGTKVINLPLPTIANVKRGWKPAKNMNERIWEAMNASE